MKRKILLLFFGILLTYGLSAQHYWEYNYPWDASGYTEWDAVADSFQVSLSPDSAWVTTQLVGLLSTEAKNNWSTSWGARYSIAISNQELSVTFNPSVDELSSFNINFFDWVEGDAPDVTENSFIGTSGKIGGYIVNFQPTNDGFDNGIIRGEILVPNTFETDAVYPDSIFIIRCSVFDAHGHEFNAGGDAFDTIQVSQYGTWTNFSIDYDNIRAGWGGFEPNPGDGWSETFHGVARPIAKYKVQAPIDFTKIVGLRFYLCPGKKLTTTIFDNSIVKLRNITVGCSIDGYGIHSLTPKVAPYCLCGWSVEEIFNNPSVVSIGLINLLGQTIATVKSMDEVTLKGFAILKVLFDDGSVEVVKIAK